MASVDTPLKTMKENATCSICLELMTKPVSINCGHCFCLSCIMTILDNQHVLSSSEMVHCPLCRLFVQKESIRPVKELENIIDSIKKMQWDSLCEVHGEQLQLFCEDDEQLICWTCERTSLHKGHKTALAEDAGRSYKVSMWFSVL